MTREEAIKALTKERKTALHENKQAFDMAIKALRHPNAVNYPDYATNGMMIMKISGEYYAESNGKTVTIEIGGKAVDFDLEWWFSPFRKEQE